MNWESFEHAYQAADEQTRAKIDSGQVADCVAKVVAEGLVAEGMQSPLINIFSHFVLNNLSELEVVKQLEYLGIPRAVDVLERITPCLTQTPDTTSHPDLSSAIAETEAALQQRATPPPTTPPATPATPPTPNPPTPTSAPTPADHSSPIHTMQQDISAARNDTLEAEAAPVHRSSQDELFAEREPTAEQRWGQVE